MKRLFAGILALCAATALSAQTGIIETREANRQSGKILTMEETIMSRELHPENLYCNWLNDKEILMYNGRGWDAFDIETRTKKPYRPKAAPQKIFTKGQSIYHRIHTGDTIPVAVSHDPNITYGQFVSRNEFGIEEGIFWAPDSSKVAFSERTRAGSLHSLCLI